MAARTVLPVDPRNPGQVLACCGLLELLLRLEGPTPSMFQLAEPAHFTIDADEQRVVEALDALARCPVRAPEDDSLSLGEPFHLHLEWWLDRAAGIPVPKTWAGGVRPRSFFPAYQRALRPREQKSSDWWDTLVFLDSASPGLDPREFTHSLDTGFSVYHARLNSSTFPYVQILALIGLQRFRPKPEQRGVFSYTLWDQPLLPLIASLTFAGQSPVGAGASYVFRLRSRDQENRYKAFSYAERKGGNR